MPKTFPRGRPLLSLRSWHDVRWNFRDDNEEVILSVPGRVIVDDVIVVLQSALSGLGVAYMARGYADRLLAEGRLQEARPSGCQTCAAVAGLRKEIRGLEARLP